MTTTAKLTRDTETRVSDTKLNAETGECTVTIEIRRKVILSLTGAEPMDCGYSRPRRFLPDTLVLHFVDHELRRFIVYGNRLRKGGEPGQVRDDAEFESDGSRYWSYNEKFGPAPADIMMIVKRYTA